MRDLARRIRGGEFPPGKQLPSEVALAREYGITRARIRTALAALARAGLIAPHPGTGWFVQTGKQAQTVGQVLTFSQWATAHGRKFSSRIVHRERAGASAREAGALGIRLGEEIIRTTRVRLLEDRPVMIERATWAPLVLDVIEALADDVPSVFGALHAAGVRAFLADHRIEAVAASVEDAQLLGVRRSSPLLQVGVTATTRDGQVVECEVERYVPNFVSFDVRAEDVIRTLLPPQRDGYGGRP